MLENVDSEFGDIYKEEIDSDDDIGIEIEDFELNGKDIACKLDMPFNEHVF